MGASKYFWLRMNKDFFKRHDIRIIESQPNGKDYIIFYLKLLCESTSHEGYLRFSETIPYNENMLATITNTNIDIVRNAIKIFTELQMMQLLDDGTYYFNQVEKMIGSETGQTIRKREAREQKKYELGNSVVNLTLDIEKEKDIEIDKDIEKEIFKEKENVNKLEDFLQAIEIMLGRAITGKNADIACKIYDEFGYRRGITEIEKNIDKMNPIAYSYKVLQNPIADESGSEWLDNLKKGMRENKC